MRHVVNSTAVALGGALTIPVGLVRQLRGEPPPDETAALFSVDPAARSGIERVAVEAVHWAEEAKGCRVVDVSAAKCGWDLTSYPPFVDGRQPTWIQENFVDHAGGVLRQLVIEDWFMRCIECSQSKVAELSCPRFRKPPAPFLSSQVARRRRDLSAERPIR